MCRTIRFSAESMNELRAQGLANAQIAARMGCSYQTVLRKIGEQSPQLSRARNVESIRHARRMIVLNKIEAERIETQKRIVDLNERREQLKKNLLKIDKQLELETLRLNQLRA